MQHIPNENIDRVRFNDYMVHFEENDMDISFFVYPIVEWERISDNATGISYLLKNTRNEMADEFDEEKVEEKFEGSFCWRGVWEGRLYFKEDEYWGEELKEMSELYENKIVPYCKDYIRKNNPDKSYDD